MNSDLVDRLKWALIGTTADGRCAFVQVSDLQEAISALEAIEAERRVQKQSTIDPQCAGQIFMGRHPLDKRTDV